jgi:NhaP-type Na+/H+ or K+/H+ antiporter
VHEGIDDSVMAAVAAVFVVWAVWSRSLERRNVGAPIAFVVAGAALTIGSDPILEISLRSEALLELTEIALALVLFGDAATVPLRRLRAEAVLPARLLGLGLPLTMAIGTLAAHWLLPGISWWVAAAIGASVAPTDAALGAAIVEDERVPARIRRLLNVESGLNDGIVTPFVSFFLLAAVVGTSLEEVSLVGAAAELAIGVAVGAVVGVACARALSAARRAGWAEAATLPIAALATAVGCFAGAGWVGGNGFVAAFVGGLAYGAAAREQLEGSLALTHQVGQVLSSIVWFLFGAVVLDALADAGWREVAFAAVALTVARMGPVALALVGTGFDRATVGVVGWFGPRGLASVVFALLASQALPPDAASVALGAISATVLASVVLHGLSASPLAGRYGASHAEPGGAFTPDG